MNKKYYILKDIFNVMFSNFIFLLSGILGGFMIPIILGPLNYGYYRIFTLYASYTAIFHFGFIDGILLDYGGKNYNSLDYNKVRTNTLFFICFQFIISIIIFMISYFITIHVFKIIFILLSINIFLVNLISYYQNISQATMRFNELSIVKIIQAILNLVAIIILVVLYKLNKAFQLHFYIYVFITFLIYIIMLFWYVYKYKNITFGKHVSINKQWNTIKHYFILGFYLTISYQASTLMFNLDSQFVSFFFDTKTYGIYSFSYTMISASLSILSAAATVLLPHLQKKTKYSILKNYSDNITYVILSVYILLIGYFPLKFVIYHFLPEYINSLVYFRILLPGIVISACINLIISNYYNALKKIKFYFILTIISLLCSIIVDSIVYISFHSPTLLAFASVLSLLLWYMIAQYFLVCWYNVKWIKNFVYIIVMMIIFFIISSIDNLILSSLFFVILYGLISFSLFKHFIKVNIINKIFKMK